MPTPDVSGKPRLSDFIRDNMESIIVEWIDFARTRTPASDGMTKLALRDHIEEILNFVADDLESPQTKREQAAKSRGLGPAESELSRSAAEIHAALRLADGFDIDQMVSEYRALRASVVKQWTAGRAEFAPGDLNDLTRFNEAIDQAMTESVAHYTQAVDHSRNLFLGVLGHDLRNPIGAASMAAQVMLRAGDLTPKQTTFASEIINVTGRATDILNDLLDVTRSAFGHELPVLRKPMDLGQVAVRLVAEMRAISNGRPVELEVVGDVSGEWDHSRVGQVFSNLIGNALQHSTGDTPVTVRVVDHGAQVILSVHNHGGAIPPEQLKGLFDGTGRGDQGIRAEQFDSTHLGLGLFITRKIAAAHGGDIAVTSAPDDGTTFSVTLPRR